MRASVGLLVASAFVGTAPPIFAQDFNGGTMCRNIKPLFNFDPPAADDEVRASALQYVRKVSGYNAPSQANEAAFERAVERVTAATRELVDALVTTAPPKDREVEAAKRRERALQRFG